MSTVTHFPRQFDMQSLSTGGREEEEEEDPPRSNNQQERDLRHYYISINAIARPRARARAHTYACLRDVSVMEVVEEDVTSTRRISWCQQIADQFCGFCHPSSNCQHLHRISTYTYPPVCAVRQERQAYMWKRGGEKARARWKARQRDSHRVQH